MRRLIKTGFEIEVQFLHTSLHVVSLRPVWWSVKQRLIVGAYHFQGHQYILKIISMASKPSSKIMAADMSIKVYTEHVRPSCVGTIDTRMVLGT